MSSFLEIEDGEGSQKVASPDYAKFKGLCILFVGPVSATYIMQGTAKQSYRLDAIKIQLLRESYL